MQNGGGNIQLLLITVSGNEKDLATFCGVGVGYPAAVLNAGFSESDYSEPYVEKGPGYVKFMLSGGWGIYNNIRELLAVMYPTLTFEIYALDVDTPQGEIHEYRGKRATVQVIKDIYLSNYAKCIFGKHDKFGNARRLTRKSKGKCVNYKLSKFLSRKRKLVRLKA